MMEVALHTVLVDLDNTVYDYEQAAKVSRRRMTDWVVDHAHVPYPLVHTAYEDVVHETAHRIFRSGNEMRILRFETLASRLGVGFDAKLLADLFGGWLLEAIKPYPGAVTALSHLMRHYSLMIVSEGYADIQGAISQRLGIEDIELFATFQTGTRKIDGSAYVLLAKSRGLDTRQSVMIGDNWEKDVVAAANCHLRTIWISHGNDTPGRSPDGFMGLAGELSETLPLFGIRG